MNLPKNSIHNVPQDQARLYTYVWPWKSLRGLLFGLVCLALTPALCVALYTGLQSRQLLIDQALGHVQTQERPAFEMKTRPQKEPMSTLADISSSPQIRRADRMMRNTFLGALGVAILVLWITRLISHIYILRPAAALVRTARLIGLGHFNVHIQDVPEWGELGLVAQAFEHMAHDLAQRTEKDAERLQALHDYASRIKALLNATTDSVVLLSIDGRVQALNDEAARKRGLKPDDLLGQTIFDFYQPAIVDQRKQSIRQVFNTGKPVFFEEHVGERWTWVTFHPIHDGQGNVVQLASFARDMSRYKHAENALRQAEERYRLLVELAPVGIYQSLPEPHAHYIQVNRHFAQIFGYESPEEVLRIVKDIAIQIYVDPKQRCLLHERILTTGAVHDFESENRHYDGSIFWTMRNVRARRSSTGEVLAFEGFVSDITDRKLVENKLKHQAYHDELTGLANRGFFLKQMRSAIETAVHDKLRFAMLFLDLDNFKLVNDGFGHPVGDDLLSRFSSRLKALLAGKALVARFGGDEFGVLISPVIDLFAALHVAKDIHAVLNQSFRVGGSEIVLSASIGLVLCKTGYLTPEDVLRDADIAMYRAKHRGKGQTEVFDKDMYRDLLRRVELEQGLRRAVPAGEIIVYYQPYFDLNELQLAGFEALVRWRRHDGTIVSPAEFIPVAEDAGIILEIGPYVLREACKQMVDWLDKLEEDTPLTMSVNVSGREIYQGDPVGQIRQTLASTGLPGHRLRLEVTETVLMDDLEIATEVLEAAHAQGVTIALDDFGTGYSSLGYLRSLPLDVIKIDRSFVQNLDHPGRDQDIVHSIVDLAHGLELDVIAEGLETEAVLGVLTQAGCDYGQGFLMSRPLPSKEAFALIARCYSLKDIMSD
ncbi:bifunctional diguanylate cyclase/phosphodiesterase [Desulfovibrio inopinatus]|uniref:bifunctional diguanylate cyclase/phosphodiesterase n=1 Tax=Desulfovibrio inopinatus TaxID=102109 RepID=UPI0006876104|nr:EAL domain-containing protein [Desulfovibrio inopinatus]